MLRILAGVGVAAAATVGAAQMRAEAPRVERVAERWTGIEFATRVGEGGGGGGAEAAGAAQVLAGVAVRCMMGRCEFEAARVYAVGVYVGEAAVGDDVAGDVAAGVLDPDVFEAAVADRVLADGGRAGSDVMLRIVFAKPIGGKHVAKGFDRSLVKRLRAAHGGVRANPSKPHLKAFTSLIKRTTSYPAGTVIEVTWRARDDALAVAIDGGEPLVIPDPILAREMFDLYLGPTSNFRAYPTMRFRL